MNTQDGIFCGVPLTRHLEPGATNSFTTSLLPGTVVSADVIDTANSGVLKLQSVNFSPATGNCTGDLLLTAITDQQMMPLAGTLNVTDCFSPPAAHDYTISLSVVSSGPGNCAVPLPCSMPLDAGFGTKGEVDSYTFPGQQGDTVSLAVTKISSAIGQVRVRLFDPAGKSIFDGFNTNPTCQGSLTMQLPTTGAYTALISSCNGARNGQYTVTWHPPSCAAKQPPGQFAYVPNADSGTMSVVDLSTNTTRATIPIVPAGLEQAGSATYVAITPNGGFAYATYGPSNGTAVLNTGTNLLTASVPTGIDSDGLFISPDGATVYVVSNSLQGVAFIDTMTNKVTRVVPLEAGTYQGLDIASAPDGTFMYLVEEDTVSGLVKISTEDYMRAAVLTIDLGIYDAFAVTPDGSQIYAGVLGGIAVVDTTTFMQTDTIPMGEPFAIAFTPDGHTAYATLPDGPDPNNPDCGPDTPCPGVVAVIDTSATPRLITTISNAGDNPGGIAISPDTGLVYVTDIGAGADDPGVFVIDPKIYKVVASLPSRGDGPAGVALTTAPTGLCIGDAHGQTEVTIDELVLSVNYSLNGCPGRFPSMSVPFP